MSPGNHSPGARFRAIREAQGKSLRGLSRESGVDPSNLSRIERGLQRPSLGALVRIGKALGLKNLTDTISLFYEEPPEKQP
jgi:transcriptional regulator with XRE-family HTH domain